MSDVAGSPGRRQVEGRLVARDPRRSGRPDRAGARRTVRDEEVLLSWRAPDANGAPIDLYEVRDDGAT